MLSPIISSNTPNSITHLNTAKASKAVDKKPVGAANSEADKNKIVNTEVAHLALQQPTHEQVTSVTEKPADEGFTSTTATFNSQPAKEEQLTFTPDEQRYGRKRPDLPLTFGFGIKRYTTLPLAMRFSLVAGQAPTSPQEAIKATLNLAATNSVAYAKGSQVNLYL